MDKLQSFRYEKARLSRSPSDQTSSSSSPTLSSQAPSLSSSSSQQQPLNSAISRPSSSSSSSNSGSPAIKSAATFTSKREVLVLSTSDIEPDAEGQDEDAEGEEYDSGIETDLRAGVSQMSTHSPAKSPSQQPRASSTSGTATPTRTVTSTTTTTTAAKEPFKTDIRSLFSRSASSLPSSPVPSFATNMHRSSKLGNTSLHASLMGTSVQAAQTVAADNAAAAAAAAAAAGAKEMVKPMPFKQLVKGFRYDGADAPPAKKDENDMSDIEFSGGEEHKNKSSSQARQAPSTKHPHHHHHHSSVKPSNSTAAAIRRPTTSINIDEDEDDEDAREAPKPKKRLIRKGDLDRVDSPEPPKRRRLVKRAVFLDSDDDEEDEESSRSSSRKTSSRASPDEEQRKISTTTATTTSSSSLSGLVISDDDLDAEGEDDEETEEDRFERILSDLQATFQEKSALVLRRVLTEAKGDYAVAARALTFHTGSTSSSTTTTTTTTTSSAKLSKLKQKSRRPPSSDEDSDGASSPDEYRQEYRPKKEISLDEKEELACQFFNEATMLDIQELTGCSKQQASGVVALRPFENYDNMCVLLRKTKGVGEKIVTSYITTTDAIKAVDSMLRTVDRVRDDLVSTLSIWCGDSHKHLFASAENSNRIDHTTTPAEPKEDDDEGDDPGMGLVEINAAAVENTEEGKRAMKGFIRTQPKNLAKGFQLKGYQLLGINWLALLWRKKLSGILADEMGLGKTAQVIAFFAHLLEIGETGPHLVIVPSSTLANWQREFQNFCPELDVRAYYGTQAEREELRYELDQDPSYNVIVTTYNIATGNNDERKFLNRRNFKTIVLDEGHMVKNCTSARYKQLMSIKTDFRLLLTGTPLQNNLEELLSLLIFIMPSLFTEHEEVLRTMFKVKVDAKSEKSTLLSQQRILRARHMIAPFVLRRRKIHVLKDLPKKVEKVIYCDLAPKQRAMYDRIFQSSGMEAALKAGDEQDAAAIAAATMAMVPKLDPMETDGMTDKQLARATKKNAKAIAAAESGAPLSPAKAKKVAAQVAASTKDQFANMLMQLRKCADHPMLFRELYTDKMLKNMAKTITREVEFCESNIDYIEEDMAIMTDFELHRLCKQYKSVKRWMLEDDYWMEAGKVQVLQKLLPNLIQKEKSRILIFSQFTMVLDILEDVLKTMKILYLRMDGQTKVDERQGLIDSFNDSTKYPVFLLSTKAGGFGINLTGANVVIMYDLDFNPHNDKQAEDRAHRVGQKREVQVIKLIAKDTIEEQIYGLANLKLKLDHFVSSEEGAIQAEQDADAEAAAAVAGKKKGKKPTKAELAAAAAAATVSTPSAGILSMIKQSWKANQEALAKRGGGEGGSEMMATIGVTKEQKVEQVEEQKKEKSHSRGGSTSSLSSSLSFSGSLSPLSD